MEQNQRFYDYEDIEDFSESDSESNNQDNQQGQLYKTFNVNQKQKEQLPDHACDYCGIHHKDKVVKCISENCGRWFCNGKGDLKQGSHIIMHLAKAKHKEIKLHSESQQGETILECYICQNKNLFLLGFVPLSGDDKQVIINCRTPCLQKKNYNDMFWDPNDWTALIEERMIVNWLVQQPTEQEQNDAFPINWQQISQLEDLRKKNPTAQLNDINTDKIQKNVVQDLLLKYRDGQQYYEIMSPLINMEAQYDKQLKESQTQSMVNVRWDISLKKKRLAYFVYNSQDNYENELLPGNELKLSLKSHDWSSTGHIIKISSNEEVCLELKNQDPPPMNVLTGYTVELVWKSTSYKRMEQGLKQFWKNQKSISSYLFFRILGFDHDPPHIDIDIPKTFSAPNLPELNYYQIEAVKKALQNPLCLIQGPPGTGKTVTCASIVYHLVQNMRKKKTKQQILVCAPSNIVVDQLSDKINQTGVKIVRICSKSRESVSSNVEYLTLQQQVKNLDSKNYDKLQYLYLQLEEIGFLDEKDDYLFNKLRHKAEEEILQEAEVICTTCVTSQDQRLKKFQFQHVLIDEATQAIEPECLLPMLKGAKQVILVGDHRQLGPVVLSRDTVKAGLNKSLFERLVSMSIRPLRLQVQYRMHPELSIFPSNTFYEGTLQNGVTITDRTYLTNFKWPIQEKPLFFFNLSGSEEISASGTSYLNRVEAVQIERIVGKFLSCNVKPSQIGIITPYKGQRSYIINYLQKSGQFNSNVYKEIEVVSVDGFQGREKDFIIISCVRSNEGQGIGFLNDPRRLNVTLTRAKFGMIICGNAKVLARDNIWNNLLNHYKDSGVIVDGTLENLKPSTLKFRAPQKYIPERRNIYEDDNKSIYSYAKEDQDNQSECSLAKGYRNSKFGFNQIPNVPAFQFIQLIFREQAQKPQTSYTSFLPVDDDYITFND